ncbi:uncharacterized protein LOC111594170 [Drosophila hydei]|uniref:Uncharacterized protein LOC111594170 n=1 Tax=Drosophila hydei TaxID=7224 RepID=A0A6J1LF70_DROHY|nr:uncharacterized protein LOC111594170 [Drosophila hydei]
MKLRSGREINVDLNDGGADLFDSSAAAAGTRAGAGNAAGGTRRVDSDRPIRRITRLNSTEGAILAGLATSPERRNGRAQSSAAKRYRNRNQNRNQNRITPMATKQRSAPKPVVENTATAALEELNMLTAAVSGRDVKPPGARTVSVRSTRCLQQMRRPRAPPSVPNTNCMFPTRYTMFFVRQFLSQCEKGTYSGSDIVDVVVGWPQTVLSSIGSTTTTETESDDNTTQQTESSAPSSSLNESEN